MASENGLKRLTDFFGLRRSIVGMLIMVVLVGLGEKMAERFLPIYLLALGGGILSVGFLNGMDNLLSALYSFPGGYLAERYGTKRSLLLFNLMAMFGFLLVILIPWWPAVFIGAFFFLSWTAISLPATMKLVASVLPAHKRTMGVTMQSFTRRIPMALGPVIGGFFIAGWGEVTGVRLAFVAAFVVAAFATVMQQVLIVDDRKGHPAGAKPAAYANPFVLFRRMNRPLRNLLVSDILIRFCEQIPDAFVVVWCMKTLAEIPGGTAVSAPMFGLLTTVEMATAMAIYIPVAYLADRSRKKPFVAATFVFFTAFPLVLSYCHSFWPLVGAFVLRGFKEFGEPTRKALIMDLAPDDQKAGMFGLYYLIRDVIVSIAAFGGAFLWAKSPQLALHVAFGFGVMGTLWFLIFGRDLGPARGREETGAAAG